MRFYNENLTDDLVDRRDGVYNYIINEKTDRILNNTIFNKTRFNNWLDNPVLNFTAIFEEGVDISGDLFVGENIYANTINTPEVQGDGELHVDGDINIGDQNILEKVYPVGSIYINAQSNQNPSNLLGFGEWEEISEGRVLVGANGNLNGEGGEQMVQLTNNHLPSHTHVAYTNQVNDSHRHKYNLVATGPEAGTNGTRSRALTRNSRINKKTSSSGGDHSHEINVHNSGGDAPHNNLQPYVVVKMWKRIE